MQKMQSRRVVVGPVRNRKAQWVDMLAQMELLMGMCNDGMCYPHKDS